MLKHRVHINNTSECGKNFVSTQIHRIKTLFKGNFFKTIKYQIEEYKEYFFSSLSNKNQKIINLFYTKGINLNKQIKKTFYSHRFRTSLSDEIIIRIMFILGIM